VSVPAVRESSPLQDRSGPGFLLGGRISVANRVLAAPMCGTSKLPYRRIVRRLGADVVCTEMVKAHLVVAGCPRTEELLVTASDEEPCAAQVCGAEPEVVAEAARLLEGRGFPLIDINMGCPVRKVVRAGAGAALLRDPARVEQVVAACVAAVSVPVSVKIRSGWNQVRGQGEASAATLARAVEAGGAALLTVHGRSRDRRHQGQVDLDSLSAAKQAVAIPVVANGGVRSGQDAVSLLESTGCDAVMIGRGAHGRPWLFRDAARALAGLSPLPPPGPEQICRLIAEHLHGLVALLGPHGVLQFRKHAGWYFQAGETVGEEQAESFRQRAYRLREEAAMTGLVAEWGRALAGSSPSGG
jgi:tRNA-dihydrouridine synthase B